MKKLSKSALRSIPIARGICPNVRSFLNHTWTLLVEQKKSIFWTFVEQSDNSEDGTHAVRRQNAAPRARRKRTAWKFLSAVRYPVRGGSRARAGRGCGVRMT